MKKLSMILFVPMIANCTPVGDFCTVYDPVYMSSEAARMLLINDKEASITAAANNRYYENNCKV